MSGRGRRFILVCAQCDEIFTRRTVDARRSVLSYCSRDCHSDVLRTGRAVLEVICSGCGVLFPKARWHAQHDQRHYHDRACYETHIDRAALGRLSASAPGRAVVPPAARFLRAQMAGFARARVLSKERMSEIGRMGAAARKAKNGSRGPV